jgi:hypothetical protein
MNVFIVERGHEHEGQGIIGVFASNDNAMVFAAKQPVYEALEYVNPGVTAVWKSVPVSYPETLHLKHGERFITITIHEVQ